MKLFEVLNPMITELKDDISQYTDAAKVGFEFECLISTKKMGDPEVDDYHDEQIVFEGGRFPCNTCIHDMSADNSKCR